MLRRPRQTLAAAAVDGRWAGVLGWSTMVAAAASAGFYATAVGRLALVDQWDRFAAAVGREPDDAAYGTLQALAEYAPLYGAARAVAGVALLTAGLAVAVFVVMPRRNARPGFNQVLAVSAHASVILALRMVLSAPVSYARETAAGATSVGVWLPIVGGTSPASRVFGMLDLAIVWWAVIVALGVGTLYDRPAPRLALAFVGAYVSATIVAGTLVTLLGQV